MQSKILNVLRGKSVPNISEALELVPQTVQSAHEQVEQTLADVVALKLAILSLQPHQRTYANTVSAYDEINGLVFSVTSALGVLKQVSSDVENRGAPYEALQIEALRLCRDAAFYQAFCEYQEYGRAREVLTKVQEYFLDKALADFKRAGYDRDSSTLAQLAELEAQIQAAYSDFDATLNNDVTCVTFPEQELTGISPRFIASQQRDKDGNVMILCNRTSLAAVLPHCTNPVVRRAFKKAYDRRAYPANVENLQRMLTLRSRYASLLGFENYASYLLSGYLMGSPEQAKDFLGHLFESIAPLAARDIRNLMSTLPADVVLTKDGKIQPWDIPYALTVYEKTHSSFDPREVSSYFPVEKTAQGIFAIYEKFMGLSFEYHKEVPGAWDRSVQGITVYTKDRSRILGYIFLDLFPRPQKYSHACCWEIVPRVTRHHAVSGMLYEVPSVSVIVANFPKPVGDTPALLLHSDVTTFFHEFGHAIHNVLSCTMHTKTSGSMGVLFDFVELPSQIMEEWMWRKDMLKLVSGHYQTGEPLPDELIDKMIKARLSGRGFFEMNQVYYSMLSLTLHEKPVPVDLDSVLREMCTTYMRGMAWDDDNKFYTSFGHLSMYGPCYYGYSLSRSFAYDAFSRIESRGLLNEEVGKEFVEKVLRPGGSAHPRELLANFLGRPASSEAYIRWLSSVE